MHRIQRDWHTAALPPTDALEVMVFTLGEQEYGIDLAKVRELRSVDSVLHMPGAPAFIKGAIDILGTRVPLVDMRVAFRTPVSTPNDFGDVVVINIDGRMLGAAVDSIVDVVTLTSIQIAPPVADALPHANCMIGIGTLGERRLLLIDIDEFMHGIVAALDRRAA